MVGPLPPLPRQRSLPCLPTADAILRIQEWSRAGGTLDGYTWSPVAVPVIWGATNPADTATLAELWESLGVSGIGAAASKFLRPLLYELLRTMELLLGRVLVFREFVLDFS